MNTIVKQLSSPQDGLPLRKEVVSVYEARKKSGFSSKSLAFQESLDLIISLANTYLQTNIVVDPLDECDPEKRKRFLHSLQTIISDSSSLVKIFVSSRDDSDIVLRLEVVPNLSIEAKDDGKDIQKFIQQEVTRCIKDKELSRGRKVEGENYCQSDRPAGLRECTNTFLLKVSGEFVMVEHMLMSLFKRFLWVDLQIKQICSMDVVYDIEARLGKLPETLEKTYTEIYNRIRSQPGSSLQLAQRALMWVMCSCRPFSPDELVTIISLGSTTENGLDVDGLFKLCHNILTLDRQLNAVRFAHLSVREFLEKPGVLGIVDAHSMASKFCLSFLMNPKNLDGIRALGRTKSGYKCPVLGYPAIYWPTHVQECLDQQEGLELPELLIDFLRTSTTNWYETYVIISHGACWESEGPSGVIANLGVRAARSTASSMLIWIWRKD